MLVLVLVLLVLVLVLLLLSGALSFCPRFRGLVTSVPKCAAFHFSCFLFSQVSLSRAALPFFLPPPGWRAGPRVPSTAGTLPFLLPPFLRVAV